MSIPLTNLIVTQNGLRNPDQLHAMRRFVGAGGKFTDEVRLAFGVLAGPRSGPVVEPPRMHIARFGTNRLYLHDGHHRAVAMYLEGRKFIMDDEYETGWYNDEDYRDIHFERGWYTPFDIDTQVRLPDFGVFKTVVRGMLQRHSEDVVRLFIMCNKHMYLEPRRVRTVAELADASREAAVSPSGKAERKGYERGEDNVCGDSSAVDCRCQAGGLAHHDSHLAIRVK